MHNERQKISIKLALSHTTVLLYIEEGLHRVCLLRRLLRGGAEHFVMAWGNATFPHNSRGRPTSIRAGLIRKLAQRCQIFLVDEWNTSKLCCCCHVPMTGLAIPGD